MSIRLPKAIEQIVKTPNWPGTVGREPLRRNIGVDYDSSWTRRPAARAIRRGYQNGISAPFTRLVARPTIYGIERLQHLEGPVIFAANHTSHLDTAIVLAALPERFRRHTVVAAAADYFFDRPWKAALSSLALGAIPVERQRVNRKSADDAAALVAEGWSLVIFPEGGRSPDGWGQEFRGGAAYLAKRCNARVVPIHLKGVRPIFPKGSGRIRPGEVEVRIGEPLRPYEAGETGRDEDARRFALRVEQAVAALGDEAESDWWSARRRFYAGETPDFRGPDTATWRRSWSLPESAQRLAKRTRTSHKPW